MHARHNFQQRNIEIGNTLQYSLDVESANSDMQVLHFKDMLKQWEPLGRIEILQTGCWTYTIHFLHEDHDNIGKKVSLEELQDARNQPKWEQQLSDVQKWNKETWKKISSSLPEGIVKSWPWQKTNVWIKIKNKWLIPSDIKMSLTISQYSWAMRLSLTFMESRMRFS